MCKGNLFKGHTFLSDHSPPLIIVDNSPNMHNTGLFPDCQLLSLTHGSIWIPYLARYSEIFKKLNFQVVKLEVHVHLKNAFQAELETEGLCLARIFGLPPTPRHGFELQNCEDKIGVRAGSGAGKRSQAAHSETIIRAHYSLHPPRLSVRCVGRGKVLGAI